MVASTVYQNRDLLLQICGVLKSNAQVKRYLQTLKNLDLIEFQGSPKTGKYLLTEKFSAKIKHIS